MELQVHPLHVPLTSAKDNFFHRAQRIELQARVVLELSERRAMIGNTRDISDSGVFFTIGYPPFHASLQEYGFLHLMPLVGHPPLPCQIARLTDDGVAVRFIDHCPPDLVSELVAKR
ncbi:MAG: PilZ domain-containing protein [Magnetococcales bacterium]|nr:PilZ domain-containing protein [Magnetococcales bacterium]MBF0149613.1 PilZ domain-containing protein [Magnetococcales bacterium]MBF0172386.1 PilZ domain-containing protein [Magnetococcales bacterium]